MNTKQLQQETPESVEFFNRQLTRMFIRAVAKRDLLVRQRSDWRRGVCSDLSAR